MFLQPFSSDELTFAWCHRVYFRFLTHRRRNVEALKDLLKNPFAEILDPYGIRILEMSVSAIDLRLLVSLDAPSSVSSAASKIKGRLSKWLSEHAAVDPNTTFDKYLARGYFAVTTGKSSEEDVAAYLERQAEHHGYNRRARPPTFVQSFVLNEADENLLATDHAATRLRYHIVLATQGRRGVFFRDIAVAATECWRGIQSEIKAVIQKVSFVPDHVHVAVALHSSISPVAVVVHLMNRAQELLWRQFDDVIIRAGINRLFQTSTYVGSFGDLRSAAISSYLRRWESTKHSIDRET